MCQDNLDCLCWCPYHNTLICLVDYRLRIATIVITKSRKQWKARLISFQEVYDRHTLPAAVYKAAEECNRCADQHAREALYIAVRDNKEKVEKIMRKQVTDTYWNGKCLSYTRIDQYNKMFWYWLCQKWLNWKGV